VLLACPNYWPDWGRIVWFLTLWFSKMWCCYQCGGLGSISGQSMWDLCWTKLHWDRLFSQCLSFALSVLFYHIILIHLSPMLYILIIWHCHQIALKISQVWFGRCVPNYTVNFVFVDPCIIVQFIKKILIRHWILLDFSLWTVNFVLTTMRTSNLTMILHNLSHPRSHLLCAPNSSEFQTALTL
jgi:hypothetical protein